MKGHENWGNSYEGAWQKITWIAKPGLDCSKAKFLDIDGDVTHQRSNVGQLGGES